MNPVPEADDAFLIASEATSKCSDLESPIIVLNKDTFTVGRSIDANFTINSPIVSRIHALFNRDKQMWTVMDNKSLNGVYIDGIKLEAHTPRTLTEGNVVCFGAKTPTEEFSFSFSYSTEHVHEMSNYPPPKRRKISTEDDQAAREKERLEKEVQRMQTELECKREVELTLKQTLQNKEKEFENKMMQEKENVRQLFEMQLKKQLEELERNMIGQVDAHQSQLMLVDDDETDAVKSELEKALKVKEEHLTLLRRELKNMSEKQRESEQEVNTSRKEIVSKLNSMLETELECCICSEIIIKAVVLNCSHSFCSFCISEWKRKKCECPVCRADITSQTPSRLLDSIIDLMVESWSPELKTRRSIIVQSRTTDEIVLSSDSESYNDSDDDDE